MKKSILLLFVSIFTISGFSKEVSLSDAQKVAQNFYYLKQAQSAYNYSYNQIAPDVTIKWGEINNPDFYTVTFKTGGFIIVSGIDDIYPVIGYSLTNNFGQENQPEHYKSFLQSYADQINHVRENGINTTQEVMAAWDYFLNEDFTSVKSVSLKDNLDPLVPCQWNQGYPYNVLCPEDPNGPGGYVYAGCVATAMAQVMYYWRYPLQGTGSHSYYYYSYGNISANFGATEYDWDAMENYINHDNPNPIAELQFHCGVGVEMMYGPNGSGAYSSDVPPALVDYFGYSDDVFFNWKENFEHTVWIDMLKDNLNNGWPMYYSGFSTSGGHAFVCDGYQDDFFHFNFGWGGSSDGYYSLYDVNSYNNGQGCVFNSYPGANYPYYCAGDKTYSAKNGTIEDGSGPVDNYQDLADCTWLISPQTSDDSISSIKLKFSRFDIALDDNLIIYDGSTTNDEILATLTGSEIPEPIITTGNEMLIQFVTDDSNTSNGWLASFSSTVPDYCQGLTSMTEEQDSFTDGSGNFTYHNSTICMWAIIPDSAEKVTLTFTKFDTEEDKDVIKIFDYETQEQLAEYSGYYAPESLPLPVTSYSGKMFVTFSTNHNTTFDGWEANYYTSEVGVNVAEFENINIILYPNPVGDLINIDLTSKFDGELQVHIQNLEGKVLTSNHFSEIKEGQTLKITTAELSPGLYILSIKSSESTIHKKILKN